MTEPRFAQDLAARLIDHARSDGAGLLDATITAFDRMSAELSRSLGVIGCQALLARVLAQASTSHPALSGARVELGSNPHLELTQSLSTHGTADVAVGLEAALGELFDLLGRLVGDDLSVQLAELSMANAVPDAAKPDHPRGPRAS